MFLMINGQRLMVWLDRGTTGVNGINGSLFILKAVQFKYQHKLANPAHLMLNHTIKSLSFSVHQTHILKEKKKKKTGLRFCVGSVESGYLNSQPWLV